MALTRIHCHCSTPEAPAARYEFKDAEVYGSCLKPLMQPAKEFVGEIDSCSFPDPTSVFSVPPW